MHYLEAWATMGRNGLIPSAISKRVLSEIRHGKTPTSRTAGGLVSEKEINELIRLYKAKISELDSDNIKNYPRNLPFYLIIKDKYKYFSWDYDLDETKRGRFSVDFVCPYVDRIRPSLLSLLVNDFEGRTTSILHRRYESAYKYSTRMVKALADMFEVADIHTPDEQMFKRIASWIDKGRNGEKLTVVSPVCPDYEAHRVGNNLWRYTFDSLGTGPGIVAQRLFTAIPLMQQALSEFCSNIDFVIAIGDFEAYSEANCNRVGMTEAAFIERLRQSQRAISEACPILNNVYLFSEISGGKAAWSVHINEIAKHFSSGNYGRTLLDKNSLKEIAKSRASLYSRWHPTLRDADLVPLVLHQGAEYAAMGKVLSGHFQNCLILGADHARMIPFYSFHETLPVMYVRSSYVGVY